MENNIIAAKRFKLVRFNSELTQKEFAQKLQVKNNIADIERGRTKITGFIVAQLMKVYKINPLWLYGLSPIKNINEAQGDFSPKVITLNSEKNENMLLVDAKASAGYPSNIQDAKWFNNLPAFDFPLPEYRNATHRGFQVQGDSMYPHIKPNEWVIAKAIENLSGIKSDRIYVIVLKDSILVKKISKSTEASHVELISLNKAYANLNVDIQDIQEIWEVTSKLSFDINSIGETASIHELKLAIEKLNQQLKEVNFKK